MFYWLHARADLKLGFVAKLASRKLSMPTMRVVLALPRVPTYLQGLKRNGHKSFLLWLKKNTWQCLPIHCLTICCASVNELYKTRKDQAQMGCHIFREEFNTDGLKLLRKLLHVQRNVCKLPQSLHAVSREAVGQPPSHCLVTVLGPSIIWVFRLKSTFTIMGKA